MNTSQSRSNDSIKIYCDSTLKKQIKNTATLENKTISDLIRQIIDEYFQQKVFHQPNADTNSLNKDISRLELFITMCFKDLFYALGKAEAFEDICKHVYTDKKGAEIHE